MESWHSGVSIDHPSHRSESLVMSSPVKMPRSVLGSICSR
jgi:hypothetical protein